MAKKSIKELESEVQKLLSTDQTPQVEAQIKALEAEIAEKRAIGSRLAEAKKTKKAPDAPVQGKKEAPKQPFITFEEWKLERKDGKLIPLKLNREVRILQEHANTLNEQRENTLLEYVKKD